MMRKLVLGVVAILFALALLFGPKVTQADGPETTDDSTVTDGTSGGGDSPGTSADDADATSYGAYCGTNCM